MEVGGEFRTGGKQALSVLALAFTEELLPPLSHKAEGGIEAGQQLNGETGPVQLVPQGGVLPRRTLKGIAGTDFHHFRSAGQKRRDVHTGRGDGQQAHSGENGVPAADVVRHHEGFPACVVRHGFQDALRLIRGGVNAAVGSLLAVFFLQRFPEEAERHGRLRGGAGFGDDVDGKVHVPHQIQHLAQRVSGEAVADKVDVGRVFLFQVVVWGAEAVDDPSCA